MLLKLSIFLVLALCHKTSAIYARTMNGDTRPNVIIMHVNNMVKYTNFVIAKG
jgi:hypothetical protein